MEIATYNGRPQPLDRHWIDSFGIHTHRVAICFAGGEVRVRDFTPDLPPCAI